MSDKCDKSNHIVEQHSPLVLKETPQEARKRCHARLKELSSMNEQQRQTFKESEAYRLIWKEIIDDQNAVYIAASGRTQAVMIDSRTLHRLMFCLITSDESNVLCQKFVKDHSGSNDGFEFKITEQRVQKASNGGSMVLLFETVVTIHVSW